MLSTIDLESLIAVKKQEIQTEKALLGLSSSSVAHTANEVEASRPCVNRKRVKFTESKSICDTNEATTDGKIEVKGPYDLEESIPADLERYIRRYLGLPVMLKAGEYSPNNPLIRAERITTGDVLVGLGEYERRRNTLRKIRQQQYREYLDQQAKKKQEAKEEADRERREREEREREREERERRRIEEELERSPERRRASLNFVPSPSAPYNTKVDSAVQVDGVTRPLSVAVQTDDVDLFQLSSPSKCELTEAERELSPRTVVECSRGSQFTLKHSEEWKERQCARRRSYGDYDERTSSIVKKSNRDKLVSDLRHTYMPSIFDADAIQLRNMQSEKDAAERRQFYQQELKNQIMEQQRIKEERKTREKMLEQAEMRRLEEQLRMLKMAQEREVTKQRDITAAIRDHAEQYDVKRTELQKEIDMEKQKLRAKSQPSRTTKRVTATSRSDTLNSKLPFFYPKVTEKSDYGTNPFTINIPESSIFSSNYDVDSYLRRNLNFKDKNLGRSTSVDDFKIANDSVKKDTAEKALIHNGPKDSIGKYSPSVNLQFSDVCSNKILKSPNKIETPTCMPRKLSSLQSGNNNFEEYIENKEDNVKISTAVKRVKDRSPTIVKGNKGQYDFGDKNDNCDNDIDDIIGGNDKYTMSKDIITTHDRDTDVVVRKRNSNYQTHKEDLDKSDNVDVQVKEKNVKNTISRDKNDKYTKSRDKTDKYMTDILPIPILRHSPKMKPVEENISNMSEAMKLVDDKWKVPAVQKNILKNVNEDGKNVSILTQLGSIRRQLQLEQLKLDKMLTKDDV